MNGITSVCLSCTMPLCEKCVKEHSPSRAQNIIDDNREDKNCQPKDTDTSHNIQQLETLVKEYVESLRTSQVDIHRCIVGKKARLEQVEKLWSLRSEKLEQAKRDLERQVNRLIERLKKTERELGLQLQQRHLEAELAHKKARDTSVCSLQRLEDVESFVSYLMENVDCDAYHTLRLLLNHDCVKSRVDRLLGASDDHDIFDRLHEIHVIETVDSFEVARLKRHQLPAVSTERRESRLVVTLPRAVETCRVRLLDTCQLVMELPIHEQRLSTASWDRNLPEGLTFLPDGRLVVARQQIHIYNKNGTLERVTGGQRMRARGVSVVGDGRIAATDHLGCQLVIFSEAAEVECYDLQPIHCACALHALSVNQFLLVDLLRKAVCKVSLSAHSDAVQIEWCSKNHLKDPCGIAVNRTGDIFVSDTAQNAIKVFDVNGCYLRQFGCYGDTHCGQLRQPLGVCVDCNDNVLVADSGNHRVCMFDCDGVYIKDLLDKKQVRWPNMLALSPQGVLAVTDKAQATIRLFKVYDCI